MNNEITCCEAGKWIPIVRINKKPIKAECLFITDASFYRQYRKMGIKLDIAIKCDDKSMRKIIIDGFPYPFVKRVFIDPQMTKLTVECIDGVQHSCNYSIHKKHDGFLHILVEINNGM